MSKKLSPASAYETALASHDPLAEWCEALQTKRQTRSLSPELIYDAAVDRGWTERDLRRLSIGQLSNLEVRQ